MVCRGAGSRDSPFRRIFARACRARDGFRFHPGSVVIRRHSCRFHLLRRRGAVRPQKAPRDRGSPASTRYRLNPRVSFRKRDLLTTSNTSLKARPRHGLAQGAALIWLPPRSAKALPPRKWRSSVSPPSADSAHSSESPSPRGTHSSLPARGVEPNRILIAERTDQRAKLVRIACIKSLVRLETAYVLDHVRGSP